MLTNDPRDVLALAQARARRLRREAAAEQIRRRPRARHVVAASLRCAADRLDPAPHAA